MPLDAPPDHVRPTSSRIGDSALAERLRRELKGEVLFDAFSRGRYSTDASIYQIEPIGVVAPRDEQDVEIVALDAPRIRTGRDAVAWAHQDQHRRTAALRGIEGGELPATGPDEGRTRSSLRPHPCRQFVVGGRGRRPRHPDRARPHGARHGTDRHA